VSSSLVTTSLVLEIRANARSEVGRHTTPADGERLGPGHRPTGPRSCEQWDHRQVPGGDSPIVDHRCVGLGSGKG